MLFDFFKIEICLTCKLAILRNLFKKKIVLFILLFSVLVYLISLSNRPTISHQTRSAHTNKHKLCVIVPFRNRFNQLIELVPHLTDFLNKQNVDHQLLVVNQVDNYRFNRASLINVGFKISENMDCDYLAIHDVDLLPIDDHIKYYYPKQGSLLHLTAPGLHPIRSYNYPTFLGGILLITKEDFVKVDGMSNKVVNSSTDFNEIYY